MQIDRRRFVFGSLAGVSAGPLSARSWRRWLGPAALDARALVVVQLSGGNDALNTLVPAGDDRYRRARPKLGLPAAGLVPFADGCGLHPEMNPLRPLVERGEVACVAGVGYPNPDRSHFRSMEIWQAARLDETPGFSGWLGRAADALGVDGGAAPAIHVGSTEASFALASERTIVPSLVDLGHAAVRVDPELADAGARQRALLDELARAAREEPTPARIAAGARAAYAFAARLAAVEVNNAGRDGYPDTGLGRKLRVVSRILEAGFPTRIFAVELDGFDTHANQPETHAALLREMSGALAAFHDDLRRRGHGDRVVTFAFSEFGRRVAENSSAGTDHGAGGLVLLAGERVRGGLHGGPPDLESLQDGDLAPRVDFRSVYATLLDQWLGVDSEAILFGRFAPIPVLDAR
ncbi:MAG TPA: DUF1501 domain-containing protein [Planctomycetota bacterium]|nr:DUF1501 domain-containing protein [Planctomycetota bacterium]